MQIKTRINTIFSFEEPMIRESWGDRYIDIYIYRYIYIYIYILLYIHIERKRHSERDTERIKLEK